MLVRHVAGGFGLSVQLEPLVNLIPGSVCRDREAPLSTLGSKAEAGRDLIGRFTFSGRVADGPRGDGSSAVWPVCLGPRNARVSCPKINPDDDLAIVDGELLEIHVCLSEYCLVCA